MKRFLPLAASIAALAAGPGTAHAQMGAPAPDGPDYGAARAQSDAPPDAVSYAQQHLASLRSRLGIAANQAPAWNAFVDAVLNQSRHMQAMQSQQPPPSAPDRVARMAEMMRRSADDMSNVSHALRTLYGGLNPGQRAIVDQEFSRGPGGPAPNG
jgi:hypothetical protein